MEIYKVLDDDVTLTAGAIDHTSTVWEIPERNPNWTDKSFGLLIKLTNGATAPTAVAKAQIKVSADGSNYFDYGGEIAGSTANAESVSMTATLPSYVKYTKVVSGGNTGQDVTIRVEGVGSV